MIDLVLASASPARHKTLLQAGITARVAVAQVDEETLLAQLIASHQYSGRPTPLPPQQVQALAQAKAEQVAQTLAMPTDPNTAQVIIGCDSMLACGGKVLGKPGSAEIAMERWQQLSGKSAILCTGHWVILRRGGVTSAVGAPSTTVVHFAQLTDDEIQQYVATGEPLQVAGAFTVDGLGGPFISSIEGDYHGVVGLSLPLVRTLVRQLGVEWTELWDISRAHAGQE